MKILGKLYQFCEWLTDLCFDNKTRSWIYLKLEEDYSIELEKEISLKIDKLKEIYGEFNTEVFRLNLYFEDWKKYKNI
jgi:hypothetical protein